MEQLKNLPQDIYKTLEGKSLFDPSLLDRFGISLKELLGKRLASDEGDSKTSTLRMSNVGKPTRQLYYELKGYEREPLEGKVLVKFAFGDLTEALIIALSEAAGYKVSRFQEEIEIDGIKGHIDLFLNDVLVDVKSCSPYSFQKFKTGELLEEGNDPFGYVAQLSGYSVYYGSPPTAWVAINKQDGEICVLELPREKIVSYDIKGRIQTVKEALSSDTLPEKCYEDVPEGKSGNRKLSVGCSYCGFKFECHKDTNNGEGLKTYTYSTGPKFLTKVVKEPRVNTWETFGVKE